MLKKIFNHFKKLLSFQKEINRRLDKNVHIVNLFVKLRNKILDLAAGLFLKGMSID